MHYDQFVQSGITVGRTRTQNIDKYLSTTPQYFFDAGIKFLVVTEYYPECLNCA